MAEAFATPTIIGLTGGSGSGKSTLARVLEEQLRPRCLLLAHDRYYLPPPPGVDPDQHDFDRPDALDTRSLLTHLADLREGRPAELPCYDFATHRRLPRTERAQPCELILIEGLFVLSEPALASLLDFRVFVHTPEATRLERRLRRDRDERGRSREEVLRRFARSVRPTHERYVEPCRSDADVVVDGTRDPRESAAEVLRKLGLSRPRRGAP